MTERDRLVKVYAEVNMACDLVANIRERHHDDGQFETDVNELETLARKLYRWRERLEKKVHNKSD